MLIPFSVIYAKGFFLILMIHQVTSNADSISILDSGACPVKSGCSYARIGFEKAVQAVEASWVVNIGSSFVEDDSMEGREPQAQSLMAWK